MFRDISSDDDIFVIFYQVECSQDEKWLTSVRFWRRSRSSPRRAYLVELENPNAIRKRLGSSLPLQHVGWSRTERARSRDYGKVSSRAHLPQHRCLRPRHRPGHAERPKMWKSFKPTLWWLQNSGFVNVPNLSVASTHKLHRTVQCCGDLQSSCVLLHAVQKH